MSNIFMQMSLLAELSDEQQEVVAGGQSRDPLKSPGLFGLSPLQIFGLSLGNWWEPESGSQSDGGDCERTETKEGGFEVTTVNCQKTERSP